jgi:hypothetical protein
MAETLKVLGQVAPSATTDTTLYTVPAATSTVVSTLNVCNRSASTITYRVAVRPAGASIANQHYLAYDVPLAANDSISLTLGITLAATDVVTVRASTADTSFSAFGSEITA